MCDCGGRYQQPSHGAVLQHCVACPRQSGWVLGRPSLGQSRGSGTTPTQPQARSQITTPTPVNQQGSAQLPLACRRRHRRLKNCLSWQRSASSSRKEASRRAHITVGGVTGGGRAGADGEVGGASGPDHRGSFDPGPARFVDYRLCPYLRYAHAVLTD